MTGAGVWVASLRSIGEIAVNKEAARRLPPSFATHNRLGCVTTGWRSAERDLSANG